jgi:Uma2 family endonuclease
MVDSMRLDPELLRTETVRPLSRREYDKLVELGAFENEHVELLEGVLVVMSPQGGPHAGVTAWLARVLGRQLDWSYDVRSHSPFAATDHSEPEPDVSVSRKAASFVEHPSTALLLVEVSASSLDKDRGVKLPIYAASGVPEYWIVDLNTRTIEVYTEPGAGAYGRVERYGQRDVLRPTHLPAVAIAVDDVPWPESVG